MNNRIGIDFGTSYCTASWINPVTNKPEAVIFNDTGMPKMPSMVYYSAEGPVVGKPASDLLENCRAMEDTDRMEILASIVKSIKRTMRKNEYLWLPDGKKVKHEEVIADILKKIRLEVQAVCFQGQPVEEVVITHPVIFENWKKEMLKEAASLAGFKKIDLVEEPIAAALGYLEASGLQKDKNVLVYDFGGGTFDVAYVQYDNGKYRIPIEPDGDPFCGGDDIDRILYDRWEQLLHQKHNRYISSDKRYEDISFLNTCCQHKEKVSVSGLSKNSFSVVFPPPGFCRADMTLTRDDFDKMVAPVVDKTIRKTDALLKKIKDGNYPLDMAILIGGSSRIPLVYEQLKKILPVEPSRVMQVDVAVALGAVMYYSTNHAHKDVYCMYCGKKTNTRSRFCMFCGRENGCFIG